MAGSCVLVAAAGMALFGTWGRARPAEASKAFELALASDPDNRDALANLERARSFLTNPTR